MSYSNYPSENCDFAKARAPHIVGGDAPPQPIPGAMNRLRAQLNEAHEVFANLRARLDPVLESTVPIPAGGTGGTNKIEHGPACEHHSQLAELGVMVEELICSIRSVASRLAL